MQYEEPRLFEIKITQFAQGDDPALDGGYSTVSGGLPETSPGDNPFNG